MWYKGNKINLTTKQINNFNSYYENLRCQARENSVEHLGNASSSSVYGSKKKVPFDETDFVDHPGTYV